MFTDCRNQIQRFCIITKTKLLLHKTASIDGMGFQKYNSPFVTTTSF